MRWLRIILVAFIVVFAETTLMSLVEVRGVRPDLALIFVFFLALNADPDEAFPAFWVVGLIKDLFSAGPPGAYALLYAVCGYEVGGLTKRFFKENPLIQIAVVLPATLGVNALYLAALLFTYPGASFAGLAKSSLVCALYTTALAPPLLYLMVRMKSLFGVKPPPAFPVPEPQDIAP